MTIHIKKKKNKENKLKVKYTNLNYYYTNMNSLTHRKIL